MSLPAFDRSVLEDVNPRGRVDVLASNMLRRVAEGRGLVPQFEALRPVLDLGLLYFLGPKKEFARALRILNTPKRKPSRPPRRIAPAQPGARQPSRAARRSQVIDLLDAEVVSL